MVKSKQKKEVPKRGNAAIRVQRRRCTKVRPLTTTSTSSSRHNRSAPSTLCGIATASNKDILANNELRTMRKERRDLLQQIAALKKDRDDNEHKSVHILENERRDLIQQLTAVKKERDNIKQQSVEQLEKLENERDSAKQQTVELLEKAEDIVKTAENRVIDAVRRAEKAEKERDDVLADGTAVYDEGTELWQNVWSTTNVSSILTFPTRKSVLCQSVENNSGNDFPGVHSLGVIENGRTTQSIWMKGSGYGLVGLVTNDAEKNALCHRAGADYTKMPWMTNAPFYGMSESQGQVFTIEIDMVERCAKLYISEKDASRQLEPHKVWENIPDKVWVAVAFKRNSKREAVLMPCIHWHQKNMGNGQHN